MSEHLCKFDYFHVGRRGRNEQAEFRMGRGCFNLNLYYLIKGK